jgi:hypothetical protein
MTSPNQFNRRDAFRATALGILGLSIPDLAASNHFIAHRRPSSNGASVPDHFPNLDPEIIREVVGKSHFDLDAVKKLVEVRPELARSVTEWRFGDFESAIGAASHVGRRDIALYLMEKGARPTIFTFAMFGHFDAVESIIAAIPGIQRTSGPHGISLLDHAYAGERMKDQMTSTETDNLSRTIEYLESLGDAGGEEYMEVSPEERERYLGDYKYGSGEKDGFTIHLNMRQLIALAPIGGSGGALYKTGENKFIYNGTPSVNVSFDIQDDIVRSLTLTEPGFEIVAEKVK